ncbi:MAG: amidase [Syntrophus sp. (in: bacteria)]|nr:amidase [Syntrophus sp. (in: bacteria)]
MEIDEDKTGPRFVQEPEITVGVVEGVRELKGRFNGPFRLDDGRFFTGSFAVQAGGDGMIFSDSGGARIDRQAEMCFRPEQGSTFTLTDVTIGIGFHWERKQEQIFQGDLLLMSSPQGALTAVNRLHLEDYLASVISSEMSAMAPPEMLKAHTVASRSWLMAMLQRRGKTIHPDADRRKASGPTGEILRWYGREDHVRFDVCADDHCQRYQGITRIISDQAAQAVRSTRGVFLVHENEICDARYHKACGGRTDNFENTWEEIPVPYLCSVVDADVPHEPVDTEAAAYKWVLTRPDAYCNTTDEMLLRRVLPDFDQETADFFRWRVSYGREELEAILMEKSGIDFGSLQDLIPLQRGPSGRIMRLRIAGSKQTITVGRELEIRRWLSRSHLYSSAFCVSVERDADGLPIRFILDGAGWGHGVGMCQIGAAVMAEKGHKAEAILKHYFHGAGLKKLYD